MMVMSTSEIPNCRLQVGKTTLGNNCNSKWRSFMYTIPLSGNTVTLSGFFQFFAMRKMVICSMYIIWKVFLLPPFTPSPVYYPYHFTFPIIPVYYSYHLWIPLIPHTKKIGGIELISTAGS
jgi:hypothetical protein